MFRRFARAWVLLACVSLAGATRPAMAQGAREARGPLPRRVIVRLAPGHPIGREMPSVVFRRPGVVPRISPTHFELLPAWKPVAAERACIADAAWRDGESLLRLEGWTETLFDVDQRGRRLFLEVTRGRVTLEFADVVFVEGGCLVVDCARTSAAPGLYEFADLDGRHWVDHVRLIARADSPAARVTLMLAD